MKGYLFTMPLKKSSNHIRFQTCIAQLFLPLYGHHTKDSTQISTAYIGQVLPLHTIKKNGNQM